MASALILSIAVTSCKKKTAAPVSTTPTAPTPPTPTIFNASADGVFAAIKLNFSYPNPAPVSIPGMPIPGIEIESQLATAAATSDRSDWSNSLIDLGSVKVNTYPLKKQKNNSYFQMAMMGLTPETLDLGSSVKWEASGISLDFTNTNAFPSYDIDNLPDEITRANGITINHSVGETGARYGIMILIVSGNKTITKSITGSSSSTTITAAELNELPASKNGFIEVCPYNVVYTTSSGKTYYFIKEYAAAKMIKVN